MQVSATKTQMLYVTQLEISPKQTVLFTCLSFNSPTIDLVLESGLVIPTSYAQFNPILIHKIPFQLHHSRRHYSSQNLDLEYHIKPVEGPGYVQFHMPMWVKANALISVSHENWALAQCLCENLQASRPESSIFDHREMF